MASSSSGGGSSKGEGKGKKRSAAGVAPTASRWKTRTHFNFAVGCMSLRALPVVIHLLPDDLDWFSQDLSLFEELKTLLRDRVISITADGDADPEAPRSRKRAKKEELCIQGERLQFTYRYRKTRPRYTVLTYADDDPDDPEVEETGAGDGETTSGDKTNAGGKGSSGAAGDGKSSATDRPGFHHLPLSHSTLLVWVYRFDINDPYRPVPNAAALQFAPPAQRSIGKPLDFEAVGLGSRAGAGALAEAGPRDIGLLSWLFGEGGGDGGGDGGGGRVRQHFVGSVAWQGKPGGAATKRRGRDEQEEDDDIQRAIALSLAAEGGKRGKAGEHDFVDVMDDDDD